MSAPTDPLTPLADACPPLVDVPTGAGDADVECSNCCMPMDKPHTWRDCAEGLWKQVSAKYDDECDARMKIMELEAELAEARRVLDPATPGHRSPDWVPPQTPLGKRAHEFRGVMELAITNASIGSAIASREASLLRAELAAFRELAKRASDAIRARDTDGLGGCTSRLERDLAAHHKEPAT